ncbi:MAG: class I SAM-dependent methyltransferase [Candidatus Methylomirabilales bacterium]
MTDPIYRPEYYKRLQDGYLAQKRWVSKRIQIILEYLRPAPEDIILETGCGQGTVAYELAARCGRLYAVDKNVEAMDASRRFLDSFGRPENILLLQADLGRLPFPSESFAKVNFSEVVEHLERPKLVLQELHRILMKDGRMVVTTWPNKAHLVWNWRYRHGRGLLEDFNPQTPRSLCRLLRESDFEILDMRLTNFYLHIPGMRWEVDGCIQDNLFARICEKVLTRRPWGSYLATSINILCRRC